jgi:hypothetical protein
MRLTLASERNQFQEPFPVEWGALLNTIEKSGSLTELLNRVGWSVTRRAVAEYCGDKSRAAKIPGRTYRWLRKLESEMMESTPTSDTSLKRR